MFIVPIEVEMFMVLVFALRSNLSLDNKPILKVSSTRKFIIITFQNMVSAVLGNLLFHQPPPSTHTYTSTSQRKLLP